MSTLSDVPVFTQSQQVVVSMGAMATAIMGWDILDNIVDDCRHLWARRFSFTMVVYFISRFSSLGWAVMSYVIYGFPLGHCVAQTHIIDTFFALAMPSTALLFFVRARAVYMGDPVATTVFFILWLALCAGSITIPFATSAETIADQYCVLNGLKSYAIASPVTAVVHDTSIFFAISLRMLLNTHTEFTWKKWASVFFSGSSLPAFSKAVLQDGQLYYLITVTSNLVVLIMLYVPGVPVPYRAMFTATNIPIMNIMACRVYRKTRNAVMRTTVVSSRRIFSTNDTGPSISLGFFQAADGVITGRTESQTITENYDLEVDKGRSRLETESV